MEYRPEFRTLLVLRQHRAPLLRSRPARSSLSSGRAQPVVEVVSTPPWRRLCFYSSPSKVKTDPAHHRQIVFLQVKMLVKAVWVSLCNMQRWKTKISLLLQASLPPLFLAKPPLPGWKASVLKFAITVLKVNNHRKPFQILWRKKKKNSKTYQSFFPSPYFD